MPSKSILDEAAAAAPVASDEDSDDDVPLTKRAASLVVPEQAGSATAPSYRSLGAPPPQEQPKPVGRREVSPQQMQQWLADPRLRAVLENPRTSEKLSLLQAHPERIEDMLGDRDVVLLIRAGILDAPHKIKKQLGVQ